LIQHLDVRVAIEVIRPLSYCECDQVMAIVPSMSSGLAFGCRRLALNRPD
jgi:hypothetical protein